MASARISRFPAEPASNEILLDDFRFHALLPDEEWGRLPLAIWRRFSKRLADGKTVVYVGEVDEACRPLREIAAKKNDPAAQIAWFESWMKVAERVERLADIDAQKNHPLAAGRKYMRAGLYYLLAERMPSHKDPRRLIAYKRGIDLFARVFKGAFAPG